MLERLSSPSGLLIFAMPLRGLAPTATPLRIEGCAFDINHEQDKWEIDRLRDLGGKLSLTTGKPSDYPSLVDPQNSFSKSF